MALEHANIGRSFPPGPPYEVGREKIREFADAIGAPYAEEVTPPTFPIVLTYAANLPVLAEFGIELHNLVHGSQRFEYARPIRAGDRLTCAVTIVDIRAMAGADFLTTRGEVTDAEGELVVTAWCTLVIRQPDD